jgi:hypothetical protein
MAKINIQKDITESQAKALAEAFKSSKINIVGGETMFYENIMKAITRGQSFDHMIDNSDALSGVKQSLLNGSNGDGKHSIIDKVKDFLGQFGLESNDVKNLTISALLMKMLSMDSDEETKGTLNSLLNSAKKAGVLDKKVNNWL